MIPKLTILTSYTKLSIMFSIFRFRLIIPVFMNKFHCMNNFNDNTCFQWPKLKSKNSKKIEYSVLSGDFFGSVMLDLQNILEEIRKEIVKSLFDILLFHKD